MGFAIIIKIVVVSDLQLQQRGGEGRWAPTMYTNYTNDTQQQQQHRHSFHRTFFSHLIWFLSPAKVTEVTISSLSHSLPDSILLFRFRARRYEIATGHKTLTFIGAPHTNRFIPIVINLIADPFVCRADVRFLEWRLFLAIILPRAHLRLRSTTTVREWRWWINANFFHYADLQWCK